MYFIKVILSSFLSVVSLFVIAKVLGHKQMSQLDFFDYINGITIGSIAAELATELEKPIHPLVAMVVYGISSIVLTVLAGKFPKTRKYINGTPTIIMSDGKLYRENMKKAKLELSEFMVMCRQEGFFDITQIHTAVFEFNGKLTILPRSDSRPITPSDLSLSPSQEHIYTEVIMDGIVLEENLGRKGLDTKWLEKQLKAQKYKSPSDVYLGLCAEDNSLVLYGKE